MSDNKRAVVVGVDRSPLPGKARPALIAAYREGLSLAAVLLVQGGDKLRIIAAGHTGDAALEAGETAAARWWCQNALHAESIAEAVSRALRRINDPAANVAHARELVHRAADRHAIALLADEDITAEAMHAIARLDGEIERQMQAGGLKELNRAYRDYRLQTSARGEPVLRYAQWMERYKVKMIREIGANLRRI